jgi:hypothetical protein
VKAGGEERRSAEICWWESRPKHNQAEATAAAGEYFISEDF